MRLPFVSVMLAFVLASSVWASPEFWRHEWPDTKFEWSLIEGNHQILASNARRTRLLAERNLESRGFELLCDAQWAS